MTRRGQPDMGHGSRSRGWLSGYRGLLVVAGFAALIAVPIVALLASHQPVNLFSYLAVVWIGLCYGVAYQAVFAWGMPRLAPDPTRIGRRHMLLGAVGLAAAVLAGGALTELTLPLLGWSADQHWLVGGAIVTVVRLFHLEYERLSRRVRDTELREEKARHQAAKAELDALMARADPHFLFNSLNTVAGLIEEDPRRAVAVVTRLAGLYQHTLRAGRARTVPLAGELDAASTYLEIQALRFEGRVDYRVEADPEAERFLVPPLCLQPLVENAVLHGTSVPNGVCRITVRTVVSDDRLRLLVEDDGPGPGGSLHRGNGTALDDLGERLALLTDGRARLEFGGREPCGFRAEIELPRTEAAR